MEDHISWAFPPGSMNGAWGGGMIFDGFGDYDLAWRIGALIGVLAGMVQIMFGGPGRARPDPRPAPA